MNTEKEASKGNRYEPGTTMRPCNHHMNTEEEARKGNR
jgi:hypothetical protein